MPDTAGLGPGYGESCEQRVQAEISFCERFFGDNTYGQSFSLKATPQRPFVLEVYNFRKKIWELIDERKFTVSGKIITLIATLRIAVPPEPTLDSNRNVRVIYASDAANIVLESTVEGSSDISGLIVLAGAAPATDLTLTLSPRTGKALIDRIIVNRVAVAGTGYTVNTRTFEIFDTTQGPPVDDDIHSLFRDINLQPNAGGRLVNRTPVIDFQNVSAIDFGQVTIRISAAGGDGTSTESYAFKIQGVERS